MDSTEDSCWSPVELIDEEAIGCGQEVFVLSRYHGWHDPRVCNTKVASRLKEHAVQDGPQL